MGKRDIKIDRNTLDNILKFKTEYNKNLDILIMQPDNAPPAIAIDCDGEYWLLVNPLNGEIVGVEIEDFKAKFLKRHPEFIKDEGRYVRPMVDHIEHLEHCFAQ
jgi:hypothetical protein